MGSDPRFDHPTLLPLPSRIAGAQVVVRPWRRGDGAAIFEAVDDSRAHLARWLPWPVRHLEPEDSEEYARVSAARWMAREDLPVGLFDPSGRLLGGSGLHRVEWTQRTFEIGYWLRADAEGRGVVTEAVQLLTALAFDRLGAHHVKIRCDPRNGRSAAVPIRLGFTQEGLLRADRIEAGDDEPADTLVFGLLPNEFMACGWARAALDCVRAADGDG